ncbi:MAG TPA: hypothetical protein VFJ65_12485 [Solirubrobacterales bacterium]|nr:hypothetical protein [Solirubrobacterales bacterium]
MEAVDQGDERVGVGAAVVDVGGQHPQRLAAFDRDQVAPHRPRQHDRRQAQGRQPGDRRRGPVTERGGDAGNEERSHRHVGGEGHHRSQREAIVDAEQAQQRPYGKRSDRDPDQPVAPRPRRVASLSTPGLQTRQSAVRIGLDRYPVIGIPHP